MTTWKIDTSELDALIRAFSTEQRGQLHLASARAVASLCRRHFSQIAQTRHASANRLGATPTRHFEHANVFAEASADDAHVHIKLPGLARAFAPLTITPRRAKALTLPIAAEAYGNKVSDLKRDGWALFTAKHLRGLLMGKRTSTGEVKALYALKRQVRLRQDRSLLPADAEIAQAACNGLAKHLRNLIKG